MSVCSLHNVIEEIETKQLLCSAVFKDNFVDHLQNQVLLSAKQAICFDMGEDERAEKFQLIPQLIRLPFDTCWFEGSFRLDSGQHEKIAFLCEQSDECIKIHVFGHSKIYNKWSIADYCEIRPDFENEDITCTADSLKITSGGPWNHGHGGAMVVCFLLNWLSAFLCAMNCCNVKRIKHDPDEKLQKARQKRGKRPLYSFWTLDLPLDQKTVTSKSSGGSHRSPRLHLRRGHARRLGPVGSGVYTWVSACLVGSKDDGIVHKDYKAK